MVLLLLLAAAGGAGYWYYTTNQQNDSSTPVATNDDNTDEEKLTKFTSKKYGISFSTPTTWKVSEIDPEETGGDTTLGVYAVTVTIPDLSTAAVGFMVMKDTLDNVVADQKKSLATSDEYTITSKELKWNGYDAQQITMIGPDLTKKEEIEVTMLYIQVGEYVYKIPTKNDIGISLSQEKIDEAQWTKFLDSIEIKA